MTTKQIFKEKRSSAKSRYLVAYVCPVDGETVLKRILNGRTKTADIYQVMSSNVFKKDYTNE